MARHLLAHPEVQSRLTYVNVLSHYDKFRTGSTPAA